ncbi:hypothetical protein CCACVL1_11788 [Corchorus capsularis]|uniref:Uncharacterized protein n=1 Tax=Corchorus capsularis TaxID=210143 RepID=A0A1R3IJF4_COCAP|nr:hypothetical protein CCACVL1_11788 [Corchorus capsularis]
MDKFHRCTLGCLALAGAACLRLCDN